MHHELTNYIFQEGLYHVVYIDTDRNVRHISEIATNVEAQSIAEYFRKRGCKAVTVCVGVFAALDAIRTRARH